MPSAARDDADEFIVVEPDPGRSSVSKLTLLPGGRCFLMIRRYGNV